MKELTFQVKFLSDIVLPASSNTEGNIRQLEFIPGSNFLGMVAKNYDKFSNSFDIFHSGKVRFGDATLLVDNQELYKMPLSFFHPKLEEHRVFHHHFLNGKKLGQLKQMRSGYIFPDVSQGLKVEHINYNYAQKSAYDSGKRRSKTSSMYGYRAIEAGTKWQFVVKYDETMKSDDMELLKNTLENSKRLGKSKSSQYGQIEITQTGRSSNISKAIKENEEVILYAKSRIALVDNEGNATYDLPYLFDGAKIVYDKCQIRTSTFTPYNGAMQTKTYERLVIESGSVIVLESLSESQKKSIEQGVGIYLAEGFGELIVNPLFLMEQEEMTLIKKVKENSKKDQRKKIEKKFDNATIQFLANRHNKQLQQLALADEVQKFIEANKSALGKKINSQWGTIRSLTLQAKDADDLETLLFEDVPKEKPKGFLMSKKAKDKWDSNLIDNMKNLRTLCNEEKKKMDYIQFVRLLSMDAPKQKEEQNNEN